MKPSSLPTKISSVFGFLWLLLLIAIVLLTLYCLLFTSQSHGATVVFGNATTPSVAPFGIAGDGTPEYLEEYQQVYDGTLFPNPCVITQIAFMSYGYVTALNKTYSFSLSLGVTAKTPVSTDTSFAIGLTPVRSGPMSAHLTPAQGDFDFLIALTAPFRYDPALGNLVLDVVRSAVTIRGDDPGWVEFMKDPVTNSMERIRVCQPGDYCLPGSIFIETQAGLVTRFTTAPVPESATAALLSLGAALCIPRRPRRRIATVFMALLGLCAFHSPAAVIVSGPIQSKTEAPFGVNTKGAAIYTGEYQEIYSATLFPSAMWITQIGFSDSGSAVTKDLPYNLTIGLGVTARTPAAPGSTFVSGATQVFFGPVTAHITAAINDFDFLIPLATPFFYDPSQGNLLLDACWISAAGTLNGGVGYQYGYTNNSTKVGSIQISGPRALGLPNHGLVTQFTVNPVPEPATAALFFLGAAFCIPRRVRGDR